MSSYEERFCTNADLEFVYPFLSDINRRQVVTNFISTGGNIYRAGSTGNAEEVFRDGVNLGSAQSALSDLTEDGEWFYDSTNDLLNLYSNNNPVTNHTVEISKDFSNLKLEAIGRASEMVRSYVGKPIYQRRGIGGQSPTARDYDDIIIRSTALLAVSMLLYPYDEEKALELEARAIDKEEGQGYLDLVKTGVIRLTNETDPRSQEGIVRPVSSNPSSTGAILDIKGRGTRSDLIKVVISTPSSGNATFASGAENTVVKFSTFTGDDFGMKYIAQESDRVISGGYDPIGLGMYAKFATGIYYANDEWEVQVSSYSDYPETQQSVKSGQAERFGRTTIN
jgi:hypothetical protein|tara:strand:- start:3822 stop:4835 length:1014 start_codon:yes stop_codon:yes gene_type:complete